ncbi:MAG: hypothetical protein GEU94_19730 [Micromonosporaceae bacterium]|nr:hypothetical protein [Micromonosporaceae bacterium]
MHPLVSEAMKKAAIVWLTVGERRPYPVWCLWIDDALHVVSEPSETTRQSTGERRVVSEGSQSPGEQAAPGLDTATTATVTARGDHGGRIVSWPAAVSRVEPGGEQWEQVVPLLASKRLNLPASEDTSARWAADCVISRLEPAGDPSEAGETLPDKSHAAPPPETPAARRTAKPFRLHKVRGATK